MSKILWVISGLLIVGGFFLFFYRAHPKTVYTPQLPTQNPYTIVASGTSEISIDLIEVKENATNTPSINIEYPQFPSLSADFNKEISSNVLDYLSDFREIAKENDFSFTSSWTPVQINKKYISLIVRFNSYTGGANENQDIKAFNYDVTKKENINLSTLFPEQTDLYEKISEISRSKLTSSLRAISPSYDPGFQLNIGTEPLAENFANFTFTDDEITIYFPKYTVAAGAYGEQKVAIQRSELK